MIHVRSFLLSVNIFVHIFCACISDSTSH
uniref:Trafficking protein particle complex subunit 8 n=1 Tax=Rhizophora mucronata TaxID=61149 RepID=A0A2P2ML75_RHIMU